MESIVEEYSVHYRNVLHKKCCLKHIPFSSIGRNVIYPIVPPKALYETLSRHIVAAFQNRECQVILIHGPPGAGKTASVTEIGRLVSERKYSDGKPAFFINFRIKDEKELADPSMFKSKLLDIVRGHLKSSKGTFDKIFEEVLHEEDNEITAMAYSLSKMGFELILLCIDELDLLPRVGMKAEPVFHLLNDSLQSCENYKIPLVVTLLFTMGSFDEFQRLLKKIHAPFASTIRFRMVSLSYDEDESVEIVKKRLTCKSIRTIDGREVDVRLPCRDDVEMRYSPFYPFTESSIRLLYRNVVRILKPIYGADTLYDFRAFEQALRRAFETFIDLDVGIIDDDFVRTYFNDWRTDIIQSSRESTTILETSPVMAMLDLEERQSFYDATGDLHGKFEQLCIAIEKIIGADLSLLKGQTILSPDLRYKYTIVFLEVSPVHGMNINTGVCVIFSEGVIHEDEFKTICKQFEEFRPYLQQRLFIICSEYPDWLGGFEKYSGDAIVIHIPRDSYEEVACISVVSNDSKVQKIIQESKYALRIKNGFFDECLSLQNLANHPCLYKPLDAKFLPAIVSALYLSAKSNNSRFTFNALESFVKEKLGQKKSHHRELMLMGFLEQVSPGEYILTFPKALNEFLNILQKQRSISFPNGRKIFGNTLWDYLVRTAETLGIAEIIGNNVQIKSRKKWIDLIRSLPMENIEEAKFLLSEEQFKGKFVINDEVLDLMRLRCAHYVIECKQKVSLEKEKVLTPSQLPGISREEGKKVSPLKVPSKTENLKDRILTLIPKNEPKEYETLIKEAKATLEGVSEETLRQLVLELISEGEIVPVSLKRR
ncbi:MAG: hypothetical protein QXS74_09965 [Nitrososphaeria archaeon]